MFLFFLLGGGALKMLLVLRGGQRKNIITVEFLLSLPLYNKWAVPYYKQNINLFLPEHYANIADVLLVKIQLNLIKNSYILNINIHKLKNI
jgi:hypothetical protein